MSRTKNAFKDWKEIRRKRALEMNEQGWRQCQIAEALGVSRAAVSQWIGLSKLDAEAWRAKVQGHRPSKLPAAQLSLIPELLSHGAEAYGFRGQLWTCARVVEVIREEFGITYHKAHVSRLLKALKLTPQLPVERDERRNEEAISKWRVEVWPLLKKRRSEMAR
jgi:transposase